MEADPGKPDTLHVEEARLKREIASGRSDLADAAVDVIRRGGTVSIRLADGSLVNFQDLEAFDACARRLGEADRASR